MMERPLIGGSLRFNLIIDYRIKLASRPDRMGVTAKRCCQKMSREHNAERLLPRFERYPHLRKAPMDGLRAVETFHASPGCALRPPWDRWRWIPACHRGPSLATKLAACLRPSCRTPDRRCSLRWRGAESCTTSALACVHRRPSLNGRYTMFSGRTH